MSETSGRLHGIDWLKAVAIVTVVYIHSYNRWTIFPTTLEQIRFNATMAAVPAFFFAAGFLSVLRPSPVSRRLSRLLAPYGVASVVALALRYFQQDPNLTVETAAWDLLTANADGGIYYFVFSLLVVTLLTQPVLRASQWVRRSALAASLVFGFLERSWIVMWPIYWSMRSPGRWLSFFLLGAELAALWAPGRSRVRELPFVAMSLLAAASLFLAAVAAGPGPGADVATYFFAHYLIATIALGLADTPAPRAVRWLSEASYTIFLYHIFIVQAVIRSSEDGSLARLSAFVLGLGGSALFTIAARRIAGSRSRLLFG